MRDTEAEEGDAIQYDESQHNEKVLEEEPCVTHNDPDVVEEDLNTAIG